ncbi:MAG: hypothetical protein AAB416_03795 [Patescibacteria group bacterium]
MAGEILEKRTRRIISGLLVTGGFFLFLAAAAIAETEPTLSPRHLFFQPRQADNVGIGFSESPVDYKLAVNGDMYAGGKIYQGALDRSTNPPSLVSQEVKMLLYSRNGESYHSGDIRLIDGNLGVGFSGEPAARVHIQRANYEGAHGVLIDEDDPESNGNPKIELRGGGDDYQAQPYIDFAGGSWNTQSQYKNYDTRVMYYPVTKLLSFEQMSNGSVALNGYSFDNKVDAKYEIDVLASVGSNDRLALSTDRVGLDVAELFETEEPVEVGEILVVGKADRKLKKSTRPYEEEIIGIVSASPALLFEGSQVKLGSRPNRFIQGSKPPVALSGRVPVKISLENGPITPGDYLTSSSRPGVAMRATEPGAIVGIALEAYDGGGEEKVLAFVNIQERNGAAVVRQLDREIEELKTKLAP